MPYTPSPNQKHVIIEGKEPCDKAHLYSAVNLEAMLAAMRDFSGRNANAFILWSYLAKNRPGFSFYLSSADMLKQTGLKKDAYDNAVALLIGSGYLVPTPEKGRNTYAFYEKPRINTAQVFSPSPVQPAYKNGFMPCREIDF